MSSQTHWQHVHEVSQPDAVSWFQPRPAASLALIAATKAPFSARIIDVGGGVSTLADHLLDLGYQDVTVLDLAASALAHSQARLAERARQVSWLVADVADASFAHPFDVWHERAVFHFLTDPAAQAAHVAKMRAALRPGGHAIVATFAENGPEQCSGLPVVRYSPESLARTLGAPFELLNSVSNVHVTPGGKEQAFIYTLFRKA